MRILIALAAAKKTRMTKLDVANAFLSSKMDVELYVRTPEGYPSTASFSQTGLDVNRLDGQLQGMQFS